MIRVWEKSVDNGKKKSEKSSKIVGEGGRGGKGDKKGEISMKYRWGSSTNDQWVGQSVAWHTQHYKSLITWPYSASFSTFPAFLALSTLKAWESVQQIRKYFKEFSKKSRKKVLDFLINIELR